MNERVKQYALFLLLQERRGVDHLIFERRSQTLKTQPGEICFPGGAIEAGETTLQAAFRETKEELMLEENEIEPLCPLESLVTPFDMVLHPWLGRLTRADQKISWDPDEVEKVIYVPLDFFFQRKPELYQANLRVEHPAGFPLPGYPFRSIPYPIFFYHYEGEMIWGFSARILQDALPTLQLYHRSGDNFRMDF